ncbi:MAG: AAA family ATPase [Hormoscilla sp. SP12CHS1]|nr:AAA family ATPase [Hormoscilla sp. SP12CHS1]
MSHIKNLTIHQFRGLRDLSLHSLGQINMLVGVNNSGKTSVLEAISTYCRPLDPLQWLTRGRDLKGDRQYLVSRLKWLFPALPPNQQNGDGKIDVYQVQTHISGDGSFPVIDSRAIYRELTGVWESGEHKSGLDFDQISLDATRRNADLELVATIFNPQQHQEKQECSEHFQLWENGRLLTRSQVLSPKKVLHQDLASGNLMLPVEIVTPLDHWIENLQVGLLSEAILQRFKPEVIKLLQVIDSGIVGLEILDNQGIGSGLYIDHKQLGLAPLSICGNAVRRLLLYALTLAKVRGGVLLIDELETSIHTDALGGVFSWLVQWCSKMDVQLFATTQSLEAVDAMLDATSEDVDLVLYRLRPEESQTKLIRLDRETLCIIREELGQEVRR